MTSVAARVWDLIWVAVEIDARMAVGALGKAVDALCNGGLQVGMAVETGWFLRYQGSGQSNGCHQQNGAGGEVETPPGSVRSGGYG